MEPALQRRVQRYGWDKAASLYEKSWHDQLKPAQDLLLVMADIKKGERILDIACGTGLVSFPAKERSGEEGYLLGTDISDKMVEQAGAASREKKLSGIQFERMDAEALLVPDSSFDVALCSLGLMYFPDPLQSLREMRRVLRPGGRAVAAVWGTREHCGWTEIFEIVDRRVASEVCPMFFNLGYPGRLELYLKTAGFAGIQVRTISTVLKYANPEEACVAAFAGGPVALAYNKFTDQVKQEVHAEYISSIEPFRNARGFEVPGEFVVAVGYNPQD